MKVTIKIKEGNTTTTEQREIEDINIMQMTQAIKVVKDILDVIRTDEHLFAVLEEMFEGAEDETVESFFTDKFASNLIGALDVLLVEVPEKAFELLSVLSGIEYDVFMQQKPEEVFDIYDAILEVNDIEKLVNRAKKSLALTKAQRKVMNLFKRETTQAQEQPQLKLSSSNSPVN